jgi:hypothetical protein
MPTPSASAARIIAEEAARWCSAEGIPRPRSLVAVMVATAWAESRLDPYAVGDVNDGPAVGLWQYNLQPGRLGGEMLAAGYTRDHLVDPRVSTRLILWVAGARSDVPRHLVSGRLVDVMDAWTRQVERPADQAGEVVRRSATMEATSGVSRYTRCADFG